MTPVHGNLRRLRLEAQGAAVFLYSLWLVTLALCWPTVRTAPAAFVTLVPGLAVAIHMHRHLHRHLGANHRQHDVEHIFPTLGAANWITLARAGAIIVLAGFLPMALHPGSLGANTLLWAPGILYLGLSLADLADGFIARRQRRETDLGKRLDIETDAAGLLVSSLLAVALGRLPVVYLLACLAYYMFLLGIWARQRRSMPVVALQQRPYARITAGFQMGLVGLAFLPILHPRFITLAAVMFMIPLMLGFLRDWLVVSCRLKTDASQQSSLDVWIRSLTMGPLPWALRLMVVAGGLVVLAGRDDAKAHLPWVLAIGLCCLLAGLGLVGRSASLLLVLLLSCTLSPFGASLPVMGVFATATALLLNGTGALSLWSPEEHILYRRRRHRPHPGAAPP